MTARCRAHGRRVCVAAAVVLLFAGASVAAGAQDKACIVYRHNDDLLAKCGLDTVRIAHEQGLLWYTIFRDRLVLGAIAPGKNYPTKLAIYGGGARREVEVQGTTLYSSCGLLISASLSNNDTESWDVLAGSRLSLRGLARPVCSSDETVVIGLDKTQSLSSSAGGVLLDRDAVGDPTYGLSPSGEFSAFSNGDGVLCVSKSMGSRSVCYRGSFPRPGTLAVDDLGRVLYAAAAGGPCFYTGSAGQFAARSGADDRADACYGIFVLSAETPPKLVVPWGESPTWATRQTVEALAKQARR